MKYPSQLKPLKILHADDNVTNDEDNTGAAVIKIPRHFFFQNRLANNNKDLIK